ncbi:MAG: hypothetical protein M1834_005743 [Cirrosporium novae-zelandiae]|nr:MAG: hypothetical protein M1834_005743 [Cirrosporium novae-zelandiae]
MMLTRAIVAPALSALLFTSLASAGHGGQGGMGPGWFDDCWGLCYDDTNGYYGCASQTSCQSLSVFTTTETSGTATSTLVYPEITRVMETSTDSAGNVGMVGYPIFVYPTTTSTGSTGTWTWTGSYWSDWWGTNCYSHTNGGPWGGHWASAWTGTTWTCTGTAPTTTATPASNSASATSSTTLPAGIKIVSTTIDQDAQTTSTSSSDSSSGASINTSPFGDGMKALTGLAICLAGSVFLL